jgi:hypothetical protein
MLRMKKILGFFVLLFLFGFPARAQDTPAPLPQPAAPTAAQDKHAPKEKPSPRERPKYDISVGYLFRSYYPPTSPRFGMNGFDASMDYNLYHRWLSVAGEITGTFGSQTINVPPKGTVGSTPVPTHTDLFTAMIGPRVYPFGHNHKITPYGQVLFGGGYVRENSSAVGGFPASTASSSAKAFSGGGGFKLRWRPNWDINLAQLDYESTYFFPGVGTNGGQGNFRISVGISYRLGRKQ